MEKESELFRLIWSSNACNRQEIATAAVSALNEAKQNKTCISKEQQEKNNDFTQVYRLKKFLELNFAEALEQTGQHPVEAAIVLLTTAYEKQAEFKKEDEEISKRTFKIIFEYYSSEYHSPAHPSFLGWLSERGLCYSDSFGFSLVEEKQPSGSIDKIINYIKEKFPEEIEPGLVDVSVLRLLRELRRRRNEDSGHKRTSLESTPSNRGGGSH